MSAIKVSVSADTIQMVWNGQVTAQDMYQGFHQLAQALKTNQTEMNLIVIVDANTQLPSIDAMSGMPTALRNVKLRDTLIIGKNPKVNHAISTILSLIIPPNTHIQQ